jgi:putative ABC transport system permease protein
LGRKLLDDSAVSAWAAEVVGVVESTHQQRPEQRPAPEIYWLYAVNPWAGAELVVRATGEPKTLVPAMRAAVAELDANLPLSNIQTMGEVLTRATEGRRFMVILVGIFAGLILTLAMTGIYGVLSYQVAQRRRELGLRMALGAGRPDLFRLVIVQALWLVAVGLEIGLFLAISALFITRSLLYLPSPTSWLYFGAAAGLVLLCGLTATLIPAWRAARVDPMTALRCE